MIETIDQITTDDLFNALGDSDFVKKLYDASERRRIHYADWYEKHPHLHKMKDRFSATIKVQTALGKLYSLLS